MAIEITETGFAATLRSIADEVQRDGGNGENGLQASAIVRKRLGEMIVSAYSGRTTFVGA